MNIILNSDFGLVYESHMGKEELNAFKEIYKCAISTIYGERINF